MTWTFDPIWWITAVELPALAGLFVLIWRARRDAQEALEHAASRLDVVDGTTRDQLAAFKVEVATGYASIHALRDSESRLTAHLVRIEKKLDSLGFGRPALGDRP
jgi:hypothetical protein